MTASINSTMHQPISLVFADFRAQATDSEAWFFVCEQPDPLVRLVYWSLAFPFGAKGRECQDTFYAFVVRKQFP